MCQDTTIRQKGREKVEAMNDRARYFKVVEWSEEDQCCIGTAPGFILGGCHSTDEKDVYKEICDIAEEWIEIYKKDGEPLPPPTVGWWTLNRKSEPS